mmetsp:Transcript_97753/g.226667  ORF Transcript_97753/g.226667 Transcript_97753/m.226667 type:complete len:333 (+) Transcript_97753:188-1186(+)
MARTQGSHSTGLVICFFRSSTISLGLVPGLTGAAVVFMKTVFVGGFILGSISSSALPNFSCAGCMSGVWKAPDAFRTLACKAPAFSDSSFSAWIAASVPATEKPLGKSSLAIWQTALPPSFLTASLQSSLSLGLSRPATESMACLLTLAASCMASLRTFTSLSPSSNEKTPATHSAVYSPSERPASTWHRVTASSRSLRSFSTPASPAMNMAGWQFLDSSSLASGPVMQTSAMSMPRMLSALDSISLTAGMSRTPIIIFTYCEPWPGKSKPMGSGFSAGAAANAAETRSSSSSSGSASSPPYFEGSKPCFLAAPGRLRYQPLGGGFPHSQQL